MRKIKPRGRPAIPDRDKKVNIVLTIRPDQRSEIEQSGVNISRFVRNCIDFLDLKKIEQMD